MQIGAEKSPWAIKQCVMVCSRSRGRYKHAERIMVNGRFFDRPRLHSVDPGDDVKGGELLG